MDTTSGRHPVTALVLTKDEEAVLPRCLAELGWADEVLVLDSGSTDRTREVARGLGVRVEEQPWLGWPGQRNAAAALASHDWVFHVEADEVADHTLRSAVIDVLSSSPDPRDAWAVDRRDEFWGELLPAAQRTSKTLRKIRLYHRAHSRWDEGMLVHEEVGVGGRRHLLPGVLLHWRVQDLAENAERVARYSRIEAQAMVAAGRAPSRLRLVVLPFARFTWLYVVKGYARRGTVGYVNALLRAQADFLRCAQHWGMHRPPAPQDPPASLVAR